MTDPMQRHPAGNRVPRKRQRAAERDKPTSDPRQSDLFDHLADVSAQVAEGRRARDDGQRVARDAADVRWKAAADDALEALAASGEPFTADDLYARVRHLASSPHALGGLIGGAARRGLIVCVGVAQSKRAARHAGLQRVWQGVEGGGA